MPWESVTPAKMTVASAPGTGTVSLGVAIPPYGTLDQSGVDDGNTVRYSILDGTAYEVAIGVYSSAALTLTRVSVFSSSNNGAVINASANAAIWCDLQQSNAVSTGDLKITLKGTADPGWVMMNDGTIGSASSGATTKASKACQALFNLLWPISYCTIAGGKGASAAVDWAANKAILLPKTLGRALAVAGAGAGLTAYSLAQTDGENNHTLLVGEMPSTGTYLSDVTASTTTAQVASGIDVTALTGITLNKTTGSVGGGGAHNNMQPSSFFNVMVKL